jgi:hypothetical protein
MWNQSHVFLTVIYSTNIFKHLLFSHILYFSVKKCLAAKQKCYSHTEIKWLPCYCEIKILILKYNLVTEMLAWKVKTTLSHFNWDKSSSSSSSAFHKDKCSKAGLFQFYKLLQPYYSLKPCFWLYMWKPLNQVLTNKVVTTAVTVKSVPTVICVMQPLCFCPSAAHSLLKQSVLYGH